MKRPSAAIQRLLKTRLGAARVKRNMQYHRVCESKRSPEAVKDDISERGLLRTLNNVCSLKSFHCRRHIESRRLLFLAIGVAPLVGFGSMSVWFFSLSKGSSPVLSLAKTSQKKSTMSAFNIFNVCGGGHSTSSEGSVQRDSIGSDCVLALLLSSFGMVSPKALLGDAMTSKGSLRSELSSSGALVWLETFLKNAGWAGISGIPFVTEAGDPRGRPSFSG